MQVDQAPASGLDRKLVLSGQKLAGQSLTPGQGIGHLAKGAFNDLTASSPLIGRIQAN